MACAPGRRPDNPAMKTCHASPGIIILQGDGKEKRGKRKKTKKKQKKTKKSIILTLVNSALLCF
jgi:hypothetical protein